VNVNENMKANQDGELKNEAISLYNVKNQIVSRELILAQFCNSLEKLLKSTTDALAEYKKYDMLTGKMITVMPKKKEDKKSYYQAKAVGFSSSGNLIVRPDGGQEDITLIAEEVTIRPVRGQDITLIAEEVTIRPEDNSSSHK